MTSTAGEDVILTSHSELNGEVSRSSDTVPSVHNNIFFKTFGRAPRHHPQNRLDASHKRNGSEARTAGDDDIGEYHPGSGFVTRLLGKFSNLSSKEETVTPRLKRSSSLEGNATIDNEALKKPLSNRETTRTEYEKPVPSFPKLSHKTGSIESLNHRSRPAFPVSLRHVDRRTDHADKPLKSPRESQIIAPDADLARDDIIIIEKPSVPPLVLDKSDDDKEDSVPQISSYRDEVPIEELPKPNTVLNVRSLFETASNASASVVTYNRRNKSDSFADPKNESALNRNKRGASPITSPRILTFDTPPPAWLSRRNSTEAHTSRSRSSTETSDSLNSRTATATNYTKSSSSDDRSPSVSNAEVTPHFSRDTTKSYSSVYDSGKTLDSPRPAPSPRSTASVKPTIVSKQVSVASVKPIPISNPPSAATSFEKRQVVPVAPFKKQEETVDDGTPVMIYQKPKSPTRKAGSERTRKYEDLPAKANNEKKQSEGKDYIIPNENKLERENEVNRNKSGLSSPNNDASQVRTFDSSQTNNHEKTFSFIKPTVNDEVDDKNVPKRNSVRDSSSMGKEKTTISISGNKAQISISSDTKNKLETKKYRAPVPQKEDAPKPGRDFNKSIRAPEPPANKSNKEDKPQSMIYISSSSDTSESEASPPETPRTEPVLVSERVRTSEPLKKPPRAEPVRTSEPVQKPEEIKPWEPENNGQPVKGIPSIIAKRLNKQNNSPRELSNSIAKETEVESLVRQGSGNSIDDKPLSFKDNLESIKNVENAKQQPSKEIINSEIENEIAAVRKKMDSGRSKGSGPAQIFDSSQLAKKREEKKRQKAAAAAAQGIVPRLDFSSLNEDKDKSARMLQKEIKPCNIKFIGENAKTSRSLLKKQRKVKANVQFSETISKTFEYPNEEQALEVYLADHPNEPKELDEQEQENGILFLDGLGGGGGGGVGESSDDADEYNDDESETTVDTPRREVGAEENLKSNPALSGSGTTLQSYRGRFQEEFVFGSNMSEPEPTPQPSSPEPVDDHESMMLRPAEEENVNIWSTNNSSDLLF